MRHALTLALQSFQGAMILVSHDRSLLEAACDQFLLIDKGSLKPFDGDLEAYRAHRLAQDNAATVPAQSTQSQNRKDTKRLEAQIRQERARRTKPITQKIERAEAEMERLQRQNAECEAELSQESIYLPENKAKLQETLARATEIKVKLTKIEEDWLQWQEELETENRRIEAEFQAA